MAHVCEDIGIDCYWLAEFHFRPRTILSAPRVGASAIAARTTRMKVGLAVQFLPLANPVHVAEEAATVDHISKGRFVFGVGRSSFVDAYRRSSAVTASDIVTVLGLLAIGSLPVPRRAP